MSALAKRLQSQGVRILAISGDDAEDVREYFQGLKRDLHLSAAVDNEEKTRRAYALALGKEENPKTWACLVGKTGGIEWNGHHTGAERALNWLLDRYDFEIQESEEEEDDDEEE